MKTKGRVLPAMLAGNQGLGPYFFTHPSPRPMGLALSVIGKWHPALKRNKL